MIFFHFFLNFKLIYNGFFIENGLLTSKYCLSKTQESEKRGRIKETQKSRLKRQFPEIDCYLCYFKNIIIMKNGTVKFFNEAKGFGFITDSADKQEYFVHVSGLIDEISEGDKVEFDLKDGKKGLNAISVKVI